MVGSLVFFAPFNENNVGVLDTTTGTFSIISTAAVGVTANFKYIGAVAVGIALLRRIYSANGRSGLLLQRRKCNFIKDSYPPATNANFLSGEKFPMPPAQGIRQFFQKGLVVDRLALKDFREVVLQ